MAITAEILGGNVQLTGIPSWIKVSGGAQPENTIEYQYLLKVIDVDSKLLATPDPDGIAPDASGEVMFDISGIVDQPVDAVFQYPPSGAYVAYPTQAFSIKVQPGESYVDNDPNSATYGNIIETWGAESAEFQFLKGGISQRQISEFNKVSSSFYQKYITGGLFLTTRPWGDIVHPTQPVKLFFIPAASSTASFVVTGTYDDGSTDTYSASINFDSTKLYEFNCNPAHLGIELEPDGKRMNFFDVEIDGVSDSRRFAFDWNYCERPLFILFANSIGGVDDVYLAGRMIDKFSLESKTVKRQPARDAKVTDPVLINPSSLGQNKWVINTGYKSVTQMLHLRDMMVSRQRWLLFPNLTMAKYIVIPIIINNSDQDLINRMRDDHNFDLDISEAEKSQYTFDNRIFG